MSALCPRPNSQLTAPQEDRDFSMMGIFPSRSTERLFYPPVRKCAAAKLGTSSAIGSAPSPTPVTQNNPRNYRLHKRTTSRVDHNLDMVGVTGSIPVAPTIQSGYSALCGDVRRWPAIGGPFCFQLAVSLFLSAHLPVLRRRSPRLKIPFLAVQILCFAEGDKGTRTDPVFFHTEVA